MSGAILLGSIINMFPLPRARAASKVRMVGGWRLGNILSEMLWLQRRTQIIMASYSTFNGHHSSE